MKKLMIASLFATAALLAQGTPAQQPAKSTQTTSPTTKVTKKHKRHHKKDSTGTPASTTQKPAGK